MNDTDHLRATRLLDYPHPALQRLIAERGWQDLPEDARIGAVYAYVRDEIAFGYNIGDDIPASQVLADGYGQCNTKTTLLMALLRGVGIPARFHGATIHKRLQRGVVTGLLYRIAPRNIVHSWAEVRYRGRWTGLEGVILDSGYLDGLRATFPGEHGAFLGYAVGTENLADPPIDWTGNDTAIQATGIDRDHGTYSDPDAFYDSHGTNLTGVRAWLFRRWIRPRMNGNVERLRSAACARKAAPRTTDSRAANA